MPRTGPSARIVTPDRTSATFPRKRLVQAFTSCFRGNVPLPQASAAPSCHAAMKPVLGVRDLAAVRRTVRDCRGCQRLANSTHTPAGSLCRPDAAQCATRLLSLALGQHGTNVLMGPASGARPGTRNRSSLSPGLAPEHDPVLQVGGFLPMRQACRPGWRAVLLLGTACACASIVYGLRWCLGYVRPTARKC